MGYVVVVVVVVVVNTPERKNYYRESPIFFSLISRTHTPNPISQTASILLQPSSPSHVANSIYNANNTFNEGRSLQREIPFRYTPTNCFKTYNTVKQPGPDSFSIHKAQ